MRTRNRSGCARLGWVITIAGSALLATLTGCEDETRTVGQRIRHVVVQTVTDQGLTLDRQADPKQVVFVLLRAIKDDVEAGDDVAAREAALDRQLAVCAPDYIYGRALRKSLGRDQAVQRIVWHWAPTLAHYAEDLPTDWESARQRLLTESEVTGKEPKTDPGEALVFLPLADPSGDPDASVVAMFHLVREQEYWRVAQVGFFRGARHLERKGQATVSDSDA